MSNPTPLTKESLLAASAAFRAAFPKVKLLAIEDFDRIVRIAAGEKAADVLKEPSPLDTANARALPLLAESAPPTFNNSSEGLGKDTTKKFLEKLNKT